MKTVYRMYKIPQNETLDTSKDLDITDKYPLYAITWDKQLYKDFINQRDMTQFIVCKSKMSDSERIEFANSNNGSILEYRDYQHYTHPYSNSEHKRESQNIKILSTWSEREIVEVSIDDCVNVVCGEIEYSNTFPYIFKEKYVKALEKLEYVNAWKLFGTPSKYFKFMTETERGDLDYAYPDFLYDPVNMFIYLFKKTFK